VSAAENTDNQRETALQAYIDKISELLFDKEKNLRESKPGDEIRTIARARTLTLLRGLDATRQGLLIQFLSEAHLINENVNGGIIDLGGVKNLSGADLRLAKLSGANLSSAKLEAVDLSGADLSFAQLENANLSITFLNGANLRGANLRGANLRGADLRGADLRADLIEADLSGSHLREANLHFSQLSKANLRNAVLIGADLSNADLKAATGVAIERMEKEVKSLQGATMPDGSIHP